ncbi:Probable Co/Zn/Cd efflux system membrane fusion protein [hydrothermal vent metagenome]|uniref:Probable Co/Zn/Cd efflux system membrane fusion protein n=1 Tax=hydrothermal vent metagenome TaxID=652676 RepID=A0A3B0U1I6_9ZZZZ
MKRRKLFLQLVALTVFFAFTSCGGSNQKKEAKHSKMPAGQEATPNVLTQNDTTGMHKQHNSLADNFAHKDIVILDNPYQLGEAAKAELEQVIDAYLLLKDALVKEDVQATDKAVGLMAEKVAAVVPTRLEGKGLEAWQNHQALYEGKLKEMLHVKGLENKRSYFSHISEIMYCTIKSFGLKQGKLFAIFCPMAFNGEGSYWISDSKVIQNPYLGTKMPKCGEVRENL